jgi:hypothetical protein
MSDNSVRLIETNRKLSLIVVGHQRCEGCDQNPMNGVATVMSRALSPLIKPQGLWIFRSKSAQATVLTVIDGDMFGVVQAK